ncbi:carbon monoxide dehydrogenase [Skermanella stibiiresistens SB22]|uniref:Carbon monoxide dehydrogenase n=1 Tax=Skermanella stibiiresistens SB22 TaxID=1385369 RepID=W9H180_9PROT|nr:xanthine dehydrogenase family protein molybdopterin-binding subunit [Skermanella stibiiresistens]EWY39814.1 carbon monoxide dehydrogenase [Skermanella stibiiresistens SB22]
MAKFGIGQAVPRTEDARLLTGRGRYTDDITLPGQAHAYVLRSPHAHAKIVSIDLDDARAAPGVLGLYTVDDLEAAGISPIPCNVPLVQANGQPLVMPPRPALAKDRVRHVGDPVVFIVAETLDAARDASELVMIDYSELPAIADTVGALDSSAPQVWDQAPGNLSFVWEKGDKAGTEAGFAKAAKVVSVDVVNNRIVPNSMEGRACLASIDDTDRYVLYVSSQGVHGLRTQLATQIFNEPEEKFHILTTDVGGGFGMKIFMYPEYVLSLFAARKLNRPVKWTSERGEAFLSDDHGRDNVSHADLALDADGKFLAMRVSTVANLGAYLSNFGPYIPTDAGTAMLAGVYTTPAIHVHVKGVFTNTNPVDAYRGAGRPEAAYLLERLVDAAARELGMHPGELRRRNFIPPEAMPYKTALDHVYDTGEFARNMDDALELSDWAGFEARRAAAKAKGKLRGIGLSTYIEACSGGGPEQATIQMMPSGKVTVLIGSQSNGQGHETAYTQIVSDRLGIPAEDIEIVQGDSARISFGSGTGGSRSIPVGGAALSDTAERVIEKAKAKAAELLEAAAVDIGFEDGTFTIVGTDRKMTIQEVAAASAPSDAGFAFDEEARWTPPAATFPNGCHICELEIDPDTGGIEFINYTVVDDFGKVLNPMMLAGQVHGGVGQGIGQAVYEECVYDPDSGQLLTGSFMDYCMPRAANIPFVQFKLNEVPSTTNALGMKGAGEAGAIGAPPAVINAVVDALSPYGIRHVDMPATPQRVWRLIQSEQPALAAE